MAHYSKITKDLALGDTVDYPSVGDKTSVLTVKRLEVKEDDIALELHSFDSLFKIQIYQSKLKTVLGSEAKEESQANRREQLKETASLMGIEFKKNIKTNKLEALIEAYKNGAIKE